MALALILILIGVAVPAAGFAQQLGVPLSSLPGVEVGTPSGGGGVAGGIEGVAGGRLDRLLMAPTGTSSSAGSVGQEIERSFFGDRNAAPAAAPYGVNGGAASALTGEGLGAGGRSGSVVRQGVGVQLPSSQQLMPQHLIPGYQTMRNNAPGSPTGVGNLFTGSGQPRAGDGP